MKLLTPEAVIAAHDIMSAEMGTATGVRDRAVLEGAIGRAANLIAYGENPTVFDIAARYAALACVQAFNDGNKRIAWMAARAFLQINGVAITTDVISEAEATALIKMLAEGDLSESDLSAWIADRCGDQDAKVISIR